jgi:hypothetical protein
MLSLLQASTPISPTLQDCIDQAETHGGEPPTCTVVDGGYVAHWPDDSGVGADGGIPAGFVLLFVLAVVAGLAITVWKVTTARRLAVESGLDPGTATQMALLTDDGLESTYLASSLRRTAAPKASPATPPTPVRQRLGELKGLLDDGLITQAEHDERRRAIIDAV